MLPAPLPRAQLLLLAGRAVLCSVHPGPKRAAAERPRQQGGPCPPGALPVGARPPLAPRFRPQEEEARLLGFLVAVQACAPGTSLPRARRLQ